jgi:hypothetical protein
LLFIIIVVVIVITAPLLCIYPSLSFEKSAEEEALLPILLLALLVAHPPKLIRDLGSHGTR